MDAISCTLVAWKTVSQKYIAQSYITAQLEWHLPQVSVTGPAHRLSPVCQDLYRRSEVILIPITSTCTECCPGIHLTMVSTSVLWFLLINSHFWLFWHCEYREHVSNSVRLCPWPIYPVWHTGVDTTSKGHCCVVSVQKEMGTNGWTNCPHCWPNCRSTAWPAAGFEPWFHTEWWSSTRTARPLPLGATCNTNSFFNEHIWLKK